MTSDGVVISGISGCFPNADDFDELRDNLFNKVDMVKETLDIHWKAGAKLGIPDRIGKISKSAKFDAAFFGVHRKQCNPLDPMTRLMMERSYEAIIDAGVNPADLRGSNMGVFMGSYISESENSWMFVDTENGFGILGHNRSMLANRVSYWLNSHGPSYAFISADTCGMQGLSMAYRAMKEGRCDSALVGTANLVMHPEMSWHLCQLGLLSMDGKCKSFDADASGYARSEAVVAIFLQKSKNAKRIYANVVHSDFSFYGDRQEKFTCNLSPVPLTNLLTNFYNACGVDPRTVAYLEADGSGRKDGDQVELNVMDKILVTGRKSPLLVGSVKSNAGHAEASSNLVAVAKVLIAMQAGVIPPNLHYENPSPLIPALTEGRMKVVSEKTPWDGGLVAINAIGVTGEYGHLLLRSHDKPKPKFTDGLPRLVVASSRTEDGMDRLLTKVESMPVDPEYVRLLQDVYSVNTPNYIYRGYTVLSDGEPGQAKTREMQHYDGSKRPIWFVFSGMGSQWAGMGTQLMELPVFAASIDKCHAILEPKGVDLKHIITTTDPTIFDNILHSFVGIAAIQLALVDVLTAIGVTPDGIIGHSVGELGCAYADGCFTAEQMMLSAYSRGKASIDTELIKGTMAAVGLGYQRVKLLCPPGIEVACHNSVDSSTISGPAEQMEQFVASLQASGVFARSVNVANIAYHSKYIAPAAPTLLKYLKEVIPDPKPRTSRWVSTSVPEDRWDTPLAQLSSAEYHTNNLLSSVLFEETSMHMPKNAIAIEIAPHGLLQAILRRSMGSECTNIPLTQRGNKKGLEFLMTAIGKLYLAGLFPKIDQLYPKIEFPVSNGTPSISPLITWEHSDSWHIAAEVDTIGRIPGERDVLVSLNHEEYRIYGGHVIGGRIIFPVAAYLKIVWDTLEQIQSSTNNKLPVVFEDVTFHKELEIPERGSVKLYVLLQRGSGDFEISLDGELLASGKIKTPEKIEDEYVKSFSDYRESVDEISGDEVYRELEHRGYSYSGLFRGIESARLGEKGCVSQVKWNDNWVTFIDSMVQLAILQSAESNQSLQKPVAIQKLVINPAVHVETSESFEAISQRSIGVIHSGGVEIRGLKTDPIDGKVIAKTNFILETVKFIPHNSTGLQNVEDFLAVSMQIALENASFQQLYVYELEDEKKTLPAIADHVNETSKTYANARTIVNTISANNTVLPGGEKPGAHLIIATKGVINSAIDLLGNQATFLLVRLAEKETWKIDSSLALISQQKSEGQRLILLKKAVEVTEKASNVLHLSGEEATWSKQAKTILKVKDDKRLYLVGTKTPQDGIYSFINNLSKESGSDNLRAVFILDPNAPKFSLKENLYRLQLSQDLAINVYKDGAWGSYRHLSLGKATGSLATPTEGCLPFKNLEGIKMHYLGINLQDSGAETVHKSKQLEQLSICDLGHLEFSGFSSSGHRLMGVAKAGSKSTHLNPNQYLTWHVPDAWTLEEAATVPLAYATAYYALVLSAKLVAEEKVLIHDGCSPVGQAATAIALSRGNTVFVTVADEKQKSFVKNNFPKLDERNILSLEDTSFEILLLIATGGEGVHVIVNSLRGAKLQASLRCIAPHGRFIQLGKVDMLNNGKLGMAMFLKSTSFFGVASDNLFNASLEWKKSLHAAMQEGIKSGVVRPLDRTVFTKKQVDGALRLLGDGNKIGKVLLSVGNDKKATSQDDSLTKDESKKFQCDAENSYLIVGGRAELCFDLAEWLVARGASKIIIAQPSQTISSHVARRISLLRQHHGAQVLLASSIKATSAQGASSIIQETCSLGPLSAVFVLPSESTNGSRLSDSCINNLDLACRSLTSVSHFVCLLYDGGATLCDRRRQAGLPALAVHWPDNLGKEGNLWRALGVLDGILAKTNDSVIYVSEDLENSGSDLGGISHLDKLASFLPSTMEELIELGAEVSDLKSHSLVELASLSPGLGLVREIPPIFIVSGLQGASNGETLLKPLVRTLMYPTLCAQFGNSSDTSIVSSAIKLAEHVKVAQPEGPYNLVGASWGGPLTVEIARQLETHGDKTQVFLLDGAPESTQLMAKQLGEGAELQVNLLVRLLAITSPKVREELTGLPDWQSRLKLALLSVSEDFNKEYLAAALEAIYQRITALLEYKPSGSLVQGVVHLIRPIEGGTEHDNCGLDQFFKQTVNITLVEGDHRSMVLSPVTATVINDAIIV